MFIINKKNLEEQTHAFNNRSIPYMAQAKNLPAQWWLESSDLAVLHGSSGPSPAGIPPWIC